MIPEIYRIQERRLESLNVVTLKVLPIHKTETSVTEKHNYKPGQFNMLYTFGLGEVPISISGSRAEDQGRGFAHTIKTIGPATQKLCNLTKGEQIGLRGPFGVPWPDTEQIKRSMVKGQKADVLIIAGGLGLAPLRPLINELCLQRESLSQINLLYGTRSPQDILFKQDLENWKNRFGINVSVTVDYASPDWRGSLGHVGQFFPRLTLMPKNTFVMICGPEIMMRLVARQIESMGVPGDQIFLSLERNMKCAIGHCGHCQFGASFLCKDGPVFKWEKIQHLIQVPEV